MTNSFALEHLTRPSSLKDNAPLIIMLHGYGSDENDLFSFASELPAEYFIVSAKAPYRMQPYGNAWYAIHFDSNDGKFNDTEQAIASRELVSTFIDQVKASYPVDANRVVLLGFSQGTILSLATALSYPEKVQYVVGLSGYLSKDMLLEGYKQRDFSRLDIYMSHGSVDQVIPVQWARDSQPKLKELGISVNFSEYPVGHGVAPANFYHFKSWLEERL
ncbi:MAG: alpha/beta hydrolase-fold protein [Gilvibacter sp.]